MLFYKQPNEAHSKLKEYYSLNLTHFQVILVQHEQLARTLLDIESESE